MVYMDSKRGKASFPKELLNDSIQIDTENWMKEYFSSKNIEKGYKEKLINFFRYRKFENKSFNRFVKQDVNDFIDVLIDNNYSESGINPFLSAIREFKDYLIEKYPNLFEYYFLKDLKGLTFYNPNRGTESPLKLKILSYIRNYIKNNINSSYMFELVYQLGIEKQQLDLCLPEYADFEQKAFISESSKISF